jgi:hypothetical protein
MLLAATITPISFILLLLQLKLSYCYFYRHVISHITTTITMMDDLNATFMFIAQLITTNEGIIVISHCMATNIIIITIISHSAASELAWICSWQVPRMPRQRGRIRMTHVHAALREDKVSSRTQTVHLYEYVNCYIDMSIYDRCAYHKMNICYAYKSGCLGLAWITCCRIDV